MYNYSRSFPIRGTMPDLDASKYIHRIWHNSMLFPHEEHSSIAFLL